MTAWKGQADGWLTPLHQADLPGDLFVTPLCISPSPPASRQFAPFRRRQRSVFAQSCRADSLRSVAAFIWDAAVKVISRSSTLVIGISSDPHFATLASEGSRQTRELVSGIKEALNAASYWPSLVAESFTLSDSLRYRSRVNQSCMTVWAPVCSCNTHEEELHQFNLKLISSAPSECQRTAKWASDSPNLMDFTFVLEGLILFLQNICKAKQI